MDYYLGRLKKSFFYYINSHHPLFITDAKLDNFHVRLLLGKPQQPNMPARGRGTGGLVWHWCVLGHQPTFTFLEQEWLSQVRGLWGTAHRVSCLREQGRILLLPKVQAVPLQAPILAYHCKKQLLDGFYARLLNILTLLKCLEQTQRGIGVNKGRKEMKRLQGYFTILSNKGTS